MIEKIARTPIEDGIGEDFSDARLEDINGYKKTFKNCNFSRSQIVQCYFREATFQNCDFTGCRITTTNFREAHFSQCDFRYAVFERCLLPIKEILSNLPQWPNVRRELIQNLRANVRAVGDFNTDHVLLQHELEAERDHWRKAIELRESYYQDKYGSFTQRVNSRLKAFGLACDAWLWGHGYSFLRLISWTIAFLTALTILLFFTAYCCSAEMTLSLVLHDFRESLLQTISLYINLSNVNAAWIQDHWWFSITVSLLRYISLGLFITCFYRRLARN